MNRSNETEGSASPAQLVPEATRIDNRQWGDVSYGEEIAIARDQDIGVCSHGRGENPAIVWVSN